jgi:DNA-binding HxlR family transcriptional regulator
MEGTRSLESRGRPAPIWRIAGLLPGISGKMLIQTLCEMQDDGIVVQKDYRELPPRVVYSLSVFGKSLTEALRPLCEWGTKHMARIAALLKSAHPS